AALCSLDFHHLEVFLAGAAFRAGPVRRHILPARARRDIVVGGALRLVVDPAADQAHPRLVLDLVLGHCDWRVGNCPEVEWPRVCRMDLPPTVLAFAASDPPGGAGLQADLLTLGALGCHPLCVVTAITAQDTHGVDAVHALEPQWVTRQAERVLADIPAAAFK